MKPLNSINRYNYIQKPLDASLDALSLISKASQNLKATRGLRYHSELIKNYNSTHTKLNGYY